MRTSINSTWAVLGILALAVVGVVWAGVSVLHMNGNGADLASEFRWAVIPIVCAAGLLVALLLFAAVFSLLGLSDPKCALGLPDGSIRAVVALVLLAMFIVVPICLFSGADGSVKIIERVDAGSKDALAARLGGTPVLAEEAVKSADGKEVSPARYSVYYRVGAVREDLAKMIIPALITLVSSVCSFFFGASTAASASAASSSGASTAAPPPIHLNGTAAPGQAVLAWGPYPGAASYNVYRSNVSAGQGTTPYQAHVSPTSFTDASLTAGQSYFYRVTATLATGESPLSNEVKVVPT